ncbi:hypothetical protein PCYB_094020 [Plasmodium cynomolgi strain B]|uniref:Uncharacterized protein n=1 Tax=Plasmodium cynomolgi (strain B) TaxID=1120755 RepID=K6VBQ5_PLACD|nr:hypothetical protein PCYB_094020 [Plasmodium cynomolgi strain B]GAB66617.1 hypothetical protein PCYB_094020 [Plasmodium cynomolgi strain B]
MMDEESATENRKAKCKDNAANTTARSEYTQNYNECQVMKNSHLKKKRESFFQKINILQKFKNYKKKNATGTFHAGHNASSASANDEDREEETNNLNKKGSSGHVDYTKMYTNLKKNKSYNIKDEINSLKHKAQMLRNNIYFNGKKKADKGKLIHKNINCSSEIIRNADERDSSSGEANSLLTNFKMKSNKLKCDEEYSVEQMGNSSRAQKVEREYVFDRSSDVEVWDEGVLSDEVRSVRGNNTDEQEGLNSNSNVIDFDEYAYEEKREDEAYFAESSGAESVTSQGKVAPNVGASGERVDRDERVEHGEPVERDERGGRIKRGGCHKGDPNMDRSVWHTQGEPKRTSEFSFSRRKVELVRKVQSNINDNVRTINNYVLYSNNMGGANLKALKRTEATTTQEGGKLTSKEIITTTQYDKHTTNEDIHKRYTISKGHNDDHHERGKNVLKCIPIDREENLAQKDIIIKLMYNNNGIYFNQDENGTGGVPSRRASTAKVPSYDKVNPRVYESKSVNVNRSGSTNLHPIRQQVTYEKVTNQTNGNNEFVNPKEETDDPHLRNNNISLLPPQGGKNYTNELQKTYRALYDIYEGSCEGSYAGGVQYKAHPMTDGRMNVLHRSFSRSVDGNTGVSSSVQSRGIPLNNKIDGSRIYMCPLNRSKSMNKENAPPFEHIQKEASNLSVKATHHGYLNKASLYDTHFNTLHLMEKRRESTFRGRGNGNFLSTSGIANRYNSPIKNMYTLMDHNFVRGRYYPRQECLASKFKGRSYTFCKENQGSSGSPVGGQQSGIMKKSCTFHGYQKGAHKDGQPRGYRGAPPTMTPVVTPMMTPAVTPMMTPVVTPMMTPVITPMVSPVMTPVMTPMATGVENPITIPVATPKAHTLNNCRTSCLDVGGKPHPRMNQKCSANNAANSLAQNGNPVKCPQGNPTNVGSFFSSKRVANNWRQNGTTVGQAEQCMTYGEGKPNDSRNDYMSSNFYTPVESLKNEKLRRLQSYSSKSKAPVCLSKSQGHGAIQPNMLDGDNNGGVMKRAKSLNPARSSYAHPGALDIYQECYLQNGGAHGDVNGNRNDNNMGGGHNYMHSGRVDDAQPRDTSSSAGSSSVKKILAHDGIDPPFIGRHNSVNGGGKAPLGSCQLRENKQTFFRSSSSNETIRENYPIEDPKLLGKDKKMDHPPVSHSNNDDDIELYAVSLEQDGENSVCEMGHENGEVINLDKDQYADFTNEETHQKNEKSGHQSSTEKVVSCDGNWDTPSIYFTHEGEEPLWTAHNPNVENNPLEDEYNCENGTNSSDLIEEMRPDKKNKIKPTSKSTSSRHGSETAKHFNIVNTVEESVQESVQVNYNIGENKINYKKESIVSSSNAVCIVNKLEDEAMKMRTRKRVGQMKNKNKNPRGGEAYSSTSIQREDCNFVGSFSSRSVPLWPDCNFVGSFSSMSIKRENCSIEKRYAYLGEPPSDGNGAPRVGSFSRRAASARDSVKKMKKIKKNGNFSEGKQEKKATAISSTRVQLKKNESAEKKKKKKRKNTCTKRRSESAIGSAVDVASTGEENSSERREPLWGPKKDTEKGNSVNSHIKSNRMMPHMESANSNAMSKEKMYDEKGNSLNSERDIYISHKTDMAQTSPKDTFYEQIKQMNHILSNKNNSHFLNRINLNHLITIEKTFINTNVYINKQVISLSTRSTKGGTSKRGRSPSPHDGILYDDNFSIVYLEQDIIYLKKIFLKKILSILLSHASSFREIKITILLLYFFVSLEEGRVISPSVYPLSLINSLIQKFNLKVRKKLKGGGEIEDVPPTSFAPASTDGYYHNVGTQSDASKKGPFDCLFICDGKNYLCVNDNSLPGKTYRTRIRLNNLIGYYHYINLNRLTYYLERASRACGRAAK